jgi:hypothetical protein
MEVTPMQPTKHHYSQIERISAILSTLLLVGLLTLGCGDRVTKIADIEKNISQYTDEDGEVTIKGTVVETFSLPFIKTGAYQVNDQTGKLWVIREGDIPSRGEAVKVTGTVTLSFEFNGKPLGTVLMEKVEK